nr:hypothetical protein [Tanacetum cinerariifolium]
MFLGFPSLWCSVSMSLMNESAMSGPGKGALKRVGFQSLSSSHEVLKPYNLSKSQDVPQPHNSSSRHEISKPSKLSKSQHVSHPHKSVRENDIQESQPKVLRKRQAYMQLEDEEIQEEVQTESGDTDSGDHEDYSEDDHEVNSPQTETEIRSASHGTSVTRKETRALNEAKKKRLDKGKLVFKIDECAGHIIRQDSQRFIIKGGCLVREYGMFDGTTWKKHPDFYRYNLQMHGKLLNENSTFNGKCKRSALVDPPNGIELFDWVKLCDKFASEKFQMLSEQNKKNHSFNLIPPAVGTKSVARRIDMERRENVTAIYSYEIAHYCEKKKKMVSEEAVAVLLYSAAMYFV